MIYWLCENRNALNADGLLFKVLNVFHYHTFRAGAAFLTSFILSLCFGEWVIRKLISLKIGQPIRSKDEVQKLFDLHGKKAGTPTMGGIMILATFVISVLFWTDWRNIPMWICLGTTIALGGLGFLDDYEKVAKKNSKGVSARLKLAWQFGVAIIAALLFAYAAPGGSLVKGKETRTESIVQVDQSTTTEITKSTEVKQLITYRTLFVPSFKEPWINDMGIFSVLMFAFIIVGASNAVNLTDGLDGLASGCSISTGLAYSAFAYVASNKEYAKFLFIPYFTHADELTIVAMAMVGACFGFLWYNCQPARMFMGDTGSLALGGCIATLAIGCKQEIVLVLVGGVFVMEAMSVMIQVASFKSRGKRVFRMAPIHHHFELSGWPESQVVVRFWMMSLTLALLGLATLKIR